MELALLGLLGLFALSGSKKSATSQNKPKDTSKAPPKGTGGGGDAGRLATVAATLGALEGLGGAELAGGVAIVVANAELGGELTGDTFGAVTGGALGGGFFSGGNAINVGRVVGKELDKDLGGGASTGTFSSSGKDNTTQVAAETAGGLVGGVAYFIGGLAAISTAIFGLLVYGVVSLIDDANKLAYGQNGAWGDYLAEWDRIYFEMGSKIQAGLTAKKLLNPALRELVAKAWTHAYLRANNRSSYRQWMKRARGLTYQSDAAHAKFGCDRGYFLGLTDGKSGELLEHTASLLSERPLWTQPGPPPPWPNEIGTRTDWETNAAELCNVMLYAEWMATGQGAFISESGHLNAGAAKGVFEGGPHGGNEDSFLWSWVDPFGNKHGDGQTYHGGRLEYAGKVFFWRDYAS